MKILLIALFLASCASRPLGKTDLKPQSEFKIEQATLLSPSEKNWFLFRQDLHHLILAKKPGEDNQTAILAAMMYPAGLHKSSRGFLKFIVDQRLKQNDKNRFKVLSVSNEYVTFKNLPCVKFQTISEDHKDTGIKSESFEYYETVGYICRYPLEYVAMQFDISYRSKTKGIPADVMKTAEKFFEDIQLVEPTIERLKTIP